ncbi:MAG: insulinase family protein [Lachnospiraceae bacterium]|nr:insulinase family protein [Lachnospiraceae bacterium]
MIKVYELSNGIKTIMESCDFFHSVSFGVWVKVGSRSETKENNGIAHMTEHMLFKGTETKTAGEIARITAKLGGNLNAYTSKECTSYYCKTLPELLEPAIEVIADMVCHSAVREEDLENEKTVVCDEIDMYKDSAEDYVHEVLQKKVYKHHPLGFLISGKKKNVKGFSPKDIQTFMDKYYTGKNIVISVAGCFEPEKTLELIKKYFGELKSGQKNTKFDTPKYYKTDFIKYKDIEQLHMNLVFPAVSFLDKDKYALTLLNNILGGDVSSRLFQELREKRGLTYNICSYGSSFCDTGLLHIYAAMNPSQEDFILSLIQKIIEDMTTSGVRREELEDSIQQTVVEMTLGQDNSAGRMSSNARMLMFEKELTSFEEAIRKIKTVSLEEINLTIEKYLQIEKMSMGIVKAEADR